MGIKFLHSPKRIEDFEYELRATGKRATNLYPVMDEIVDMVLDRNRRAFETRGASTGRYWAPLKASTISRKIKAGAADPFAPLRRMDELSESLSERGAMYQTLDIDDDGFYLSTDHPSAEFHVSGTKNMPARPPLVIPESHAREYMKMIRDYVFEGEIDA